MADAWLPAIPNGRPWKEGATTEPDNPHHDEASDLGSWFEIDISLYLTFSAVPPRYQIMFSRIRPRKRKVVCSCLPCDIAQKRIAEGWDVSSSD